MVLIKRIPLVLLPISSVQSIGPRFRGIGLRIFSFYPSVRYDLRNIGLDFPPENYCTIAFLSASIWAVVLTLFIGLIVSRTTLAPPIQLLAIFWAFFISLLFFLLLHLAYPKIIAKNIAAKIDRELIFAMRDMLIQISSGIPVYNAVENVANSNYEFTSREFAEVSNKVKTGSSLLEAIEGMAVRTQSEYLKKTSWQMATAIRAGAQMDSTLKSIVKLLVDYQFSLSKSFTAELNFIILIYMMAAAVLPTMGVSILVIFSLVARMPISPDVFIGLVAVSFLIQASIIIYVKLKRPSLFL